MLLFWLLKCLFILSLQPFIYFYVFIIHPLYFKYRGFYKSLKSAVVLEILKLFILILCFVAGIAPRLFSVVRYRSIIHEFNPWFNYRATLYLVNNSLYEFLNWFDDRAWYPFGRHIGGTIHPGLMVTAAFIHNILHTVNIPITLFHLCVFLAPIFSGLTAIVTYFLLAEIWNDRAGLFAACLIAIVPGYTSHSVAGSYDGEGVAIFAMQLTFLFWIKSVKTGSIFWAVLTSIAYLYMASCWGAYLYIINLIPLHTLILIMMERNSLRLFVSYNVFYCFSLLLSMQVPHIGLKPIQSSEYMGSLGIFLFLNIMTLSKYISTRLSRGLVYLMKIIVVMILCGILLTFVVLRYYFNLITPWDTRFYSLLDASYAADNMPIIASVSKYQPAIWYAFFFDLHVLSSVFAVGIWFCIKNLNDERVFLVLNSLTAVYFAGVMAWLVLICTPVACMQSGIVLSIVFDFHLGTKPMNLPTPEPSRSTSPAPNRKLKDQPSKKKRKRRYTRPKWRRQDHLIVPPAPQNVPVQEPHTYGWCTYLVHLFIALMTFLLLVMFVFHCTWITSNIYSNPTIILPNTNSEGSKVIIDDFREAYLWLSKNTKPDARVMSWWDYGYQILAIANRTTIVDNNTWNNTQIALVGRAMASTEEEAYKIMSLFDVDYVLVVFGGVVGFSGDDINKFLWMVRIAEEEYSLDIKEADYTTGMWEFRVDRYAPQKVLNSLLYKLSYYEFAKLKFDANIPYGFDRARKVVIGNKYFKLTHFEEAYTTENWLVRIYKVKTLHEINMFAMPEWEGRNISYISTKRSRNVFLYDPDK